MGDGFELSPMTEDEDRLVVEAQIRTLNILQDALNKKQWLLAEPGRSCGQRAADVPLICPQLVEDLIQVLQQVQLLKHNRTKLDDGVCAIYPSPSAPVIGLCLAFWQRHENLSFCSCPGTLIAAAACLLGYHDHDESWFKAEMEEHQRPKLRASQICAAFEVWMSHKGKYINGAYTCCGEKAIHSVCEDSDMRFFLHCIMDEEQKELAETSRKTTLKILLDARNKRLVVDDARLIRQQKVVVTFPLITRNLLEELIKKLEKVTFKCDSKPRNEVLMAYPAAQGVIYLCPLFWKQSGRLHPGSRLGTLILCAAKMLGYSHVLDGTSNHEEPMGHQECDLVTADDICIAFENWMVHQAPYMEGSYSCCGETDEDSVCRESFMGLALQQCLAGATGGIDEDSNHHYSAKDPVSCASTANEDAIE